MVPGAGWLIRADEGSRGSARDTGFTVRGKEPPLYDSSKFRVPHSSEWSDRGCTSADRNRD